jgi:uncharacterized protein (TIGR00369 family)
MAETAIEFINEMPATRTFGMKVTSADEGRATAELPFQEALCFDTGEAAVLHGAATFALADNAGAAAMISHFSDPQPAYTIDLRIDYLDAARTDLTAEADVRRFGSVVGVADIVVEDANDAAVAIARGTYRSA